MSNQIYEPVRGAERLARGAPFVYVALDRLQQLLELLGTRAAGLRVSRPCSLHGDPAVLVRQEWVATVGWPPDWPMDLA